MMSIKVVKSLTSGSPDTQDTRTSTSIEELEGGVKSFLRLVERYAKFGVRIGSSRQEH